jgi:outer membrane protein assembly factor BamB
MTALLALAASPAGAADWPQFGFDSRHSGSTTQETRIHTGNVTTLHVLWHVQLPSIAAGAPVYLSGVTTKTGTQDLVFVTTQDGHIIALDASSGSTVWSAQPATGPMFTTSSPAIDPNRLYVYSYGLDGKAHKYQVADGIEITTGGWPEVTTLKPDVEKSSGAMATATTKSGKAYLYVVNGGYPDDAGDYQGHVTAIDLASGAQQFFNALCSDQNVRFVENGTPDCPEKGAAVWARPGVVFDPDVEKLLFATGNGLFNANTAGGRDWGDSILAVAADASGSGGGLPLDSYTPVNYQQLQDQDLDLGSTAPVVLPVPAGSKVQHLGAHVGKDQLIRLLDLDDLSGMGGPGHVGGELQAVALPQGNQVLQQPAIWVDPVDGTVWMEIANFNGISGLRLDFDGAGNPSLTPVWTNHIAGTSPVVANGMLFYAAVGVGLEGLEPTTGNVLWADSSIGNLHWESPIVADGRLFQADESAVLWAYGPKPAPLAFYTLPPCRVLDTRNPAGTYGGPAIAGGAPPRLFAIAGRCGVPADAKTVAANVTAVQPGADGGIAVAPAGVSPPGAVIDLRAGQIRANNAILGLTGYPLGSVAAAANLPPGASVHLVVDVYGYFK